MSDMDVTWTGNGRKAQILMLHATTTTDRVKKKMLHSRRMANTVGYNGKFTVDDSQYQIELLYLRMVTARVRREC